MENSRLNKLPGELRNRIYRLVLVSDETISFNLSATGEPMSYGTRSKVRGALTLLSTCKQNRAEALPIYFAENRFKFKVWVLAFSDEEDAVRRVRSARLFLAGWLAVIGTSAQHIQQPTIDLRYWKLCFKRERDEVPRFLPGLIKGLKTTFSEKTTVVFKLELTWTRIYNASRTVTFWNAASARSAVYQAFEDEESMVDRVIAKLKSRAHSSAGSTELVRADLKRSRQKLEQFIAELESTAGL